MKRTYPDLALLGWLLGLLLALLRAERLIREMRAAMPTVSRSLRTDHRPEPKAVWDIFQQLSADSAARMDAAVRYAETGDLS